MSNLAVTETSVYEAARRLLLDLLMEEGVVGAAVLDRDGEIVLYFGEGEALSLRRLLGGIYRMLGTVEQLYGTQQKEGPAHYHFQTSAMTAWIAPVVPGAYLVVLWNDPAAPGLLWRRGLPPARELTRLFSSLLPADDSEFATEGRDSAQQSPGDDRV